MTQAAKAVVRSHPEWLGYALPIFTGLLLWLTPLGRGLANLSYDLLFLFKPAAAPGGVEIVYIDEASLQELKQNKDAFDRTLHARLLDRMAKDGAKLVVFDIRFAEKGMPAANEEFRRAIQRNGRVVLSASLDHDSRPGLINQVSLLPPLEIFGEAAAGWGIAEVVGQPQSVVRQCYPYSKLGPCLPWAAAAVTGVKLPASNPESYWLNFYGPAGTIPHLSYHEVDAQMPERFRNQVIFVGSRPRNLFALEETDEFRTPYSRWGGENFPGVELLATGYLNLLHKEALTRFPILVEFMVITVCGLLVGRAAVRLKPVLTMTSFAAGVVTTVLLAVLLQRLFHAWFSWMVIAGVQVPSGLAWILGNWIVKSRPVPDFSPFLTSDGKGQVPNVPDHTLLQRIGFGAYGEVWLARNSIGMFRAVKFVFRDRYPSPDPFQREFNGVEKYMPISLNHPWLVHVLHVGKNDAGRYFFYIMEVGDDESTGQQIHAESYSPRNLSKELSKRGRFSVDEAVTLGLYLAETLQYLHSHGLIHRDIKPSNIIFVNDIPKLADVGLVTEIERQGKVPTYIGTVGYIPPEGPSAAAGDLYSLGKVLYEVSMGRDRLQYPDLPTSLVAGSGDPFLLELNQIILKACENDSTRRYQSADDLKTDLLRLQERLQARRAE